MRAETQQCALLFALQSLASTSVQDGRISAFVKSSWDCTDREDYLSKVTPAELPASLSFFVRWGPSWTQKKKKKRWGIYLSGLSGAIEKQMLGVQDDPRFVFGRRDIVDALKQRRRKAFACGGDK